MQSPSFYAVQTLAILWWPLQVLSQHPFLASSAEALPQDNYPQNHAFPGLSFGVRDDKFLDVSQGESSLQWGKGEPAAEEAL